MAYIGQVIDDKYEILKLIGKGGMSNVYLAMDKRLNKQWAIKEITKDPSDPKNRFVVESAIAEADMIKQLDYPAIVRIVDIIDDVNVIYIIEDYIEGETLSSTLEKEGVLPQEYVIDWAIQLCKALNYLHTRKPPIIYRDMKPSNVILKPDNTVRLIDFGIAREFKEENIEDTKCMGTKGYAAPEQFGGRGQTDGRTDIYCLGVTLYHLLTGKNPTEPPYVIHPIRKWNPELSAGLEKIILKCTQLDPSERYQNCNELLYDLLHYEELTEEYRNKQKKKLNKFLYSAGIAVFCFIMGTASLGIKAVSTNSDYKQTIINAENATNQTEKTELYAKAIDLKPKKTETYIALIDTFKNDTEFSVSEEEVLKKKLNKYIKDLKKDSDYPELAFEIGKLYWYYYDYGDSDNQLTRMKSSIQWFDDVVNYGKADDDFYDMSKIYCDIGTFNRDINLNIEEASDKGSYAPYWDAMTKLFEFSQKTKGENEIVDLEVYKLCLNSIETYARKFKYDGVSQAEMERLYNDTKMYIEDTEVTSDKTIKIKEDLIDRCTGTEIAISNAYREQVIEK